MEVKTSETISVTDIQRRAKEVFERIERGEQDKYVVLKNNEIAAVLVPARQYEVLEDRSKRLDEALELLEDMRIDAIAAERVATFDPAKAITHEEMLARFGLGNQVKQ